GPRPSRSRSRIPGTARLEPCTEDNGNVGNAARPLGCEQRAAAKLPRQRDSGHFLVAHAYELTTPRAAVLDILLDNRVLQVDALDVRERHQPREYVRKLGRQVFTVLGGDRAG